MKYTIVDIETTFQIREDKSKDPSPFTAKNRLVSIGWKSFDPTGEKVYDFGLTHYGYLYHTEPVDGDSPEYVFKTFQQVLDETDCLIAHNLKFDLTWLHEAGFKYEGGLYCTMVAEYLLQCAVKQPLSLDACCERHNLPLKKSDLIEKYMKDNVSFENIPKDVVTEYGMGDVDSCEALYYNQQERLATDEYESLNKLIPFNMEFVRVLSEMERTGICISNKALDEVEEEFAKEKDEVDNKLYKLASSVLGSQPVNLNSPAQLSEVLYSRRVTDKNKWADTFNIGLNEQKKPLRRPFFSKSAFNKNVRDLTEICRKTEAETCGGCKGQGSFYKKKKNGSNYKNATKCSDCGGSGIFHRSTGKVAGFKLKPRDVKDVTAHGFATDKNMLEPLLQQAREANNLDAELFLKLMVRSNALSTYLNSFVNGIRKGIKDDGLLHCNFNQTITATGRLSSSEPNFQNQPRGNTFPIRKVVHSRFGKRGCIVEADYAQLEFRVAGMLSGCPKILEDILAGVDVHSITAKVITEAGQETDRQGAKPHTFKPLYGGTSGTDAERAYYKAFGDKYSLLSTYHENLIRDALINGRIELPSGRIYAFPNAKRTKTGWVTNSTQIKNYPVQGFATGDIVPISLVRLRASLLQRKLQSKIILTVHDSIVVDCLREEVSQVVEALKDAMLGVMCDLERAFGFRTDVPLAIEIKRGDVNWLETEKLGEYSEEKQAA